MIICGGCGRRVLVSKKGLVQDHTMNVKVGVWLEQCSWARKVVELKQ